MRVVSLSQPAATLTVTREPCVPCDLGGQHWLPVSDDAVGLHERPMVSRWVTFDYACPEGVVGTRIAIAADEDEPATGRIGTTDMDVVYREPFDFAIAVGKPGKRTKMIPLPLGVVVGSAIVEATYPIGNCRLPKLSVPAAGPAGWVASFTGDLTLYPYVNGHSHTPIDVSDQLPYCDWSPGRFAWHLTDAEPLPDPVSWVSSGGRLPEWQPT